MSGYDDSTDENVDRHADHIAGKHHTYDSQCDDCRRHAEEEYKRKQASGELNRIDFVD